MYKTYSAVLYNPMTLYYIPCLIFLTASKSLHMPTIMQLKHHFLLMSQANVNEYIKILMKLTRYKNAIFLGTMLM